MSWSAQALAHVALLDRSGIFQRPLRPVRRSGALAPDVQRGTLWRGVSRSPPLRVNAGAPPSLTTPPRTAGAPTATRPRVIAWRSRPSLPPSRSYRSRCSHDEPAKSSAAISVQCVSVSVHAPILREPAVKGPQFATFFPNNDLVNGIAGMAPRTLRWCGLRFRSGPAGQWL